MLTVPPGLLLQSHCTAWPWAIASLHETTLSPKNHGENLLRVCFRSNNFSTF